MKKNIILLLCVLVLVSLEACHKDDDTLPRGIVVKNALRVKQITGHNEWWGDYRMLCVYKNEKLDSAVVYDKDGRKKGLLTGKYMGNMITLSVYNNVPMIGSEEVSILPPELIPMSLERLMEIKYTTDRVRIVTADVIYSGPQELDEDTYYYTYEIKQKQHCLYEYDDRENLIIARFSGEYAKDEPLGKYEYVYENDRIINKTEYTYTDKKWLVCETSGYSYSSDLLSWIITERTDVTPLEKIEKEFRYSGNVLAQLIVNQTGDIATISYSFNDKGFVTKIDRGNNEITQIEYEDGNGNFSLFTLPTDQITGIPFVK